MNLDNNHRNLLHQKAAVGPYTIKITVKDIHSVSIKTQLQGYKLAFFFLPS